jgi:hypothetical protein
MTMLNAATPYTCPDIFKSIILGTTFSPGVVTITNHDRIKAWDVQAAKGSTGASSKRNGDPVGRFTATFYLAGDENDEDGKNDFVRWEAFQRLLESIVDGPTSSTLPIYHPDLAQNHYTEVSVAKIGGITRDALGGATVVVEFIEYRPAKKKAVAKAQSKAAGSTTAASKPDPNAQRKREVAALLDEAKKP